MSEQNVFNPTYTPSGAEESPAVKKTLSDFSLTPHVEGGYFVVTDVDNTFVPSPYSLEPLSQRTIDLVGGLAPDFDPSLRRFSTTIYYYLTPNRPQGSFHRNRSRIIHTLHRGRGRYVLIHTNGDIESFIVGPNIDKGEKIQWVVEGGVWKASFLLPAEDGNEGGNEGLLITETVVPGFEYADHEFLSNERLAEILPEEKAKDLKWLVKH